MKVTVISAAFVVMSLGAAGASAQTTAPAPQPTATAPDAQATPTAPAPLTTSADVSDADVTQFATAALGVRKVEQDTTIADADKQPQMAAAVKAAGLTADKFNAIAKASQADPALMKRIQAAAAAQMQANPTATPSPTPAK
jgi:hypothetical protein